MPRPYCPYSTAGAAEELAFDGVQPAQDDLRVQQGDDAHGGVAQGNGNADGQNPLHQRSPGGRRIVGGGVVPVAEQIETHEAQGDDLADRNAQNRARSAIIHAHFQGSYHIKRYRKTNAQLEQDFQHLRHGGGRHVALSLGIAPHTGQQTHAEHRRSQDLDGRGGLGLVHQLRQLGRAEKHQQRQDHAQAQKQPDGGAEQLALFVPPAQSVGLTGELGDGQRQARRGDGQKDIVNVVGNVEISLALGAEDVVHRQTVDRADELHHRHRPGQRGRAAQKGLLFRVTRHEVTSIFSQSWS